MEDTSGGLESLLNPVPVGAGDSEMAVTEGGAPVTTEAAATEDGGASVTTEAAATDTTNAGVEQMAALENLEEQP